MKCYVVLAQFMKNDIIQESDVAPASHKYMSPK